MDLLNLMHDPVVTTWAVAALIGGAVTFATLGAISLTSGNRDPMRRRLKQMTGGVTTRPSGGLLGMRLAETLEPLGVHLAPKKEQERASLRLQLIRAGFRSESAAGAVYAAKVFLMLGLPVVTFALLSNFTDLTLAQILAAAAFAAFIGMIGPERYLNHRIARRKREMMRAFPDTLDLLVSCTEAGLGLNAAIARVSDRIYLSSPLLAHELQLLNAEVRSGVDRVEAFHNLVERTGLEDVRGLVSLLSQSMRFGTSVADTLRIYAAEFRDKHAQRIEEQAGKVGTKLIFPLVFCFFPAFFVVAIGPAVLALISALSGSSLSGM